MSKRFSTILILSATFLFTGMQYMPIHAADPSSQLLVQPNDLVYQGAFRLPAGEFGAPQYTGFAYGGPGVAYNPANDSLFIVGHDWYQLTAEVKIPQIIKGPLSTLKTATVLQNFADVTDGKLNLVNPGDPNAMKVSGQLVYNNKLYTSVYAYYDGTGKQKVSHFVRPLDLSIKGQTSGPFAVGTLYPGFYSGFMGLIPSEWQGLFGGSAFTGGCCHAITSIQSQGPSLSIFNPSDIGVKDPVPVTTVLGYPYANPTLGTWDNQSAINLYYNMSTILNSAVFPNGTRTILFFGKQGTGVPCYGSGTTDISLDRKPDANGVLYCYDPVNSSKGTHAYPYKPWVWAYDANNLLSVKSGQKKMWEIKPYSIWGLDSYFGGTVQGASYDSATGRIFVIEAFGDGSLPVVHVFTIGVASATPSGTTTPLPTQTLSPTLAPIVSIAPTYSPVPTLMITPVPPESNTTPFIRTSKLIRAINTLPVYYITEKGFKRHIPNEQIFLSYGNRWADIVVVSLAQVNAIPDVMLIQSLPDKRVFKLENDTRRWITSVEAFNRNGFKWDQIAPINTTEINHYPIGLDIN